MKLSKFGKALVISSVCAFSFWGVPAESVWLDAAKETTKKLEEAGQQAVKLKDIGQELKDGSTAVYEDVARGTGTWTPTTVQGVEVKQNMKLAQQKSPAERKKEAERAEQAAKKKLAELKKQIELRKQAKRVKKKAKRKAFIKQIAGHPCSEYDVNAREQGFACLQALENDRLKNPNSNSGPPSVWVRQGTCNAMKENLRKNLRSMGFWKEAIDKRVPDCKMFAELFKDKYEVDVYWSKCLEKPSHGHVQYIIDCINFSKNPSMGRAHSKFTHNLKRVYTNSLAAAGLTTMDAERLTNDVWQEVRHTQSEKELSESKAKREAVAKLERDFLYENYYEETLKRKKSKYSDQERRLIKNDKLVVPAKYAAPTSEEIRLAVMSSVVDRSDEMSHRRVGTVLRKSRSVDSRNPVVTDGHNIFLPIPGLMGIGVKFEEPNNIKCRKRKSHPGYMCQYLLGSRGGSMGRFGDTSDLASWAASYFTILAHTPVNNWFVLTERGWRQPHTDEQIAGLRRQYKAAGQRIQKRRARRYDNESMLGQMLQEYNDEMYIRGAKFGRELIGLW